MIYTCSYCNRPIRPRDNLASNGNPDAVSHGMCARCSKIAMSDMGLTVARIRELSLGSIPACMRVGGL